MKLKSVSAKKIGSYPWVPFDELWVAFMPPSTQYEAVRLSLFMAQKAHPKRELRLMLSDTFAPMSFPAVAF
jgi:hypothetical protein